MKYYYTSELNLQEHVWKTGRLNIRHNDFIDNIGKTTDKFIRFLNDTIFDYKFGDQPDSKAWALYDLIFIWTLIKSTAIAFK